jgi:protein TonB
MFDHLVTHENRRRRRLANPRTMAVSVVLHALLIGGAVYASVVAPQLDQNKEEEQVTYVDIKEQQPKAPEPPPPPPQEQPKPPTPVKGTQVLAPPKEVPTQLPPPEVNAPPARPEDFSGVGTIGGTATGVEGGVKTNAPPTDSTPLFTLEETGASTELLNKSEVVRLLQRNYPRIYAESGVGGQVRLRFIINEAGLVEPGSVKVLEATNDAFAEAAIKVVERMRFKPIRYRGSAVRVLAEQTISFQPPS